MLMRLVGPAVDCRQPATGPTAIYVFSSGATGGGNIYAAGILRALGENYGR